MPAPTCESDLLAIQAQLAAGKLPHEVATAVGVHRSTVWRLRHKELLQPELIDHASKTLANKMLLSATAALDTFLDKAEANELKQEAPGRLIKMAATAMESASTYAALSGQSDMLKQLGADLGIVQSHSASRVTLESKVTIESSERASQPVDITPSRTPKQRA